MITLPLSGSYRSSLDIRATERAIKFIKDTFERELAAALNLERVSAPLFVLSNSGLNDNLNGVERPVSFDILDIAGSNAEIVQSLAKWKRMALYHYGFQPGEGLYTDMNAIRRDEVLDNLHSVYVDQWDWELVITREQRTLAFIQGIVRKIMRALKSTSEKLAQNFPGNWPKIDEEVFCITTQELEDMYPDKTTKERETLICREKKTVFLMQIGNIMKSGQKHDGRAPDYDDWTLNGDILVYNELLDLGFEISSMGIRVDEEALRAQLLKAGCPERSQFPFHKMLLNGQLPLTIGGGLGQSRICMLLLGKAHIGEVQASVWGDDMLKACEEQRIQLL